MNDINSKFLLASSSPRRKEILEKLGVEFLAFSPEIDESIKPHELPLDYVQRIALLKAQSAIEQAKKLNCKYILSADTIVFKDEKIFDKTEHSNEAFENLKNLSGKTHEVATCFTILDQDKKLIALETVISFVEMKELSHTEIQNYLDTGEYKDKAGSYAIQGIGKKLVKSFKGSLSNIIGLPEEVLSTYLNLTHS